MPALPMANRRSSSRPNRNPQLRLEQCWLHECDIDPLILRARLLHCQGRRAMALAVEQEVQPMF
ncbi:hypothetical protein [Synechococcus sp. BS55D]|uniref:hypothetical protein n=1 Tax=Synechococcus sp. BS55D TaxID=2055943 RepID=UPI00103DA66A|nr:hypothetical protein [Synechococcus sp. BS55D]